MRTNRPTPRSTPEAAPSPPRPQPPRATTGGASLTPRGEPTRRPDRAPGSSSPAGLRRAPAAPQTCSPGRAPRGRRTWSVLLPLLLLLLAPLLPGCVTLSSLSTGAVAFTPKNGWDIGDGSGEDWVDWVPDWNSPENGEQLIATGAPYALTPTCADGLDNDGDGLIDSADPSCILLAFNTGQGWPTPASPPAWCFGDGTPGADCIGIDPDTGTPTVGQPRRTNSDGLNYTLQFGCSYVTPCDPQLPASRYVCDRVVWMHNADEGTNWGTGGGSYDWFNGTGASWPFIGKTHGGAVNVYTAPGAMPWSQGQCMAWIGLDGVVRGLGHP